MVYVTDTTIFVRDYGKWNRTFMYMFIIRVEEAQKIFLRYVGMAM